MPRFDNIAVASIFEVMADLLEIQDVDKFRFLSYRKAADSIRSWPEDIADVAAEGRLTEIPAVGPKLARAVTEILETGTFGEYEEAKRALPGSLVDLTAIPGIGPKKARVLYDELHVRSIEDLEREIEAGTLDSLRGFGRKSVESIRAGIDSYRRHHERVLLSEALPLAESVAEYLGALPGVVRAEPAGSVRRRRETIGDVDVVVAAADAGLVSEAARSMPHVTSVVGSGPGETSVMTISGIRVDVRAVPPDRFGAALLYFTGSAAHNVRLREEAGRLGLALNEHGVFRAADGAEGERLGGATEDEVYALLGMETPPPEIREDTGEVEAAVRRALPPLVELADIRGDLHAHSTSTDARSTIEENRAMGRALGYEYVAVTDHAYELKMVRGLSTEQLERQWEHVDALNATREPDDPYVLKGIELNIGDDGTLDYDDDFLARFDFCIASLHSGWGDDPARATARLLRAMEDPFVDVIGHPTGRILGRRDPIALDMETVLAKAAETGTAMEVNAYPDRLDLRDEHVREATRLGVKLSLGTDAHHARHLGFMPFGVANARRGWAGPADVLNTLPLAELKTAFKRGRAGGRVPRGGGGPPEA